MGTRILSASSLLSFDVEPDPDPLTVSTAAQPVIGRLDITVGVGASGPVFCRKVTVRIRIGAGDSALTENRGQLTSGVIGATGWTARSGYADGDWQVFEFATDRPVNVTGRAVTLVISQIEVNKATGNADLKIIEESSPTNGSFTEKTTDDVVAKFPAEFFFRNFRPTSVMVGNSEPAELKWDGSAGAEYTMFWGRNRSEVVSGVREWETPEGLTEPTGFMLQAKVTVSGVTLTHTLTTVVMVERPDLEIGNLSVLGQVGLLKSRMLLPGELEAGINVIAPTDGILSVHFPESNPATVKVYTQAMYGLRMFSSGGPHIFPVNKGSQLSVQVVAGNPLNVIVKWFGFGTSSLSDSVADS
ncbi:hypothetical protein ABH926_005170 [Catenulispora sp. GP43]|uniref:hypothetical protein n=1 Tax=Catenulispora sp. GP43 TaxID=3156263 RepID=UPI00351475E6